VFDQEYMCQPRGGMNPIVPWSAIQRCEQDYEIERIHLESEKVVQLFGEFHPATAADRVLRIEEYIRSAFAKLFAERLAHNGGFDVAASGQGDLASIYIDRKLGDVQQLGGLFTCRTEDWHFLQAVLFVFLRSLTAPTFCGDETGLGRQICWTAAQHFPGIFHPINFRGEKHDMGFALMNQLTVAEKQFPKNEPDIGADFFALRKDYQAKRWIFSEGSNPLNQASHCDIAWGGALSTKAGSMQGGPPGDIKAFDRKPHGARATDVRKFSRQEIRHSRRLIG
jgi:hypothetical protein